MRFAWLLGFLAISAVAGEPNSQRQRELLNLLKHDCGSCHGLPPKGGLGPSLMPDALAGKSDASLIETVLNGRVGTAMPPWRQFLTDEEASWLVERLRRQGED